MYDFSRQHDLKIKQLITKVEAHEKRLNELESERDSRSTRDVLTLPKDRTKQSKKQSKA